MKKLSIFLVFLIGMLLTSCADREEARRPISRSSGSFLKKSVEINKVVVAEEEEIFDSIMKANPNKEYFLSQKGCWYTYLEKSETEDYLPQAGDFVYFDSEITSVYGDTIYRKGELKTRKYMVDKEDILIGLRDGIKRLKKGEKAQFLFPSHVAYGYMGDKKRIGMNVPIIYTVTIIDIEKQDEPLKLN